MPPLPGPSHGYLKPRLTLSGSMRDLFPSKAPFTVTSTVVCTPNEMAWCTSISVAPIGSNIEPSPSLFISKPCVMIEKMLLPYILLPDDT